MLQYEMLSVSNGKKGQTKPQPTPFGLHVCECKSLACLLLLNALKKRTFSSRMSKKAYYTSVLRQHMQLYLMFPIQLLCAQKGAEV